MSATHPQARNETQIKRFLANARAKAVNARKALAIDAEMSYQLSYDAMLKASLTLMLSHGQRPKVQLGHHRLMIEFAADHLSSIDRFIFKYFDHMRTKRNSVLYDLGSVTDFEAHEALRMVDEYLETVAGDIARRHKQQRPADRK
jgi:hypothetical protein